MVRTTLVLAFISASLAVPAQAYTLLGGKTLDKGKAALDVRLGYPEVHARFFYPITKDLEVIPRFSFYYAPSFLGGGEFPGNVGDTFGTDLRYQVYSHKDFDLALYWQVAFFVNYTPSVTGGMQIGVPGGVQASYKVTDIIVLSAGFQVPLAITFDPVVLFVPINVDLGIELELTERLNFLTTVEIGPVIVVPKGGTGSFVGLNAMFLVGIQYLMDL